MSPPPAIPGRRARAGLLAASGMALALAASSCAGRAPFAVPTGTGVAEPAPGPMLADAVSACGTVDALTVELGLSGRVGRDRVRGRLVAGFDRQGRMRLEALAPFGAPAFILVGDDRTATLLMPRDGRVVRDAGTADLLEALTGLRLTASDLLPLVTGCVVRTPEPSGEAVRFANGWVRVPVGPARIAWLRQGAGDRWQTVAAEVGEVTVAYERTTDPWPLSLRLLRTPGGHAQPTANAVDVTLRVSGLDANPTLGDEAFGLVVPDDVREMSVEELRGGRPIREPGGGSLEAGAGSREPGARSPEPGARSPTPPVARSL